MQKTATVFAITLALCLTAASMAFATPSTQIWIPSTDIQPFMSVHLGFDNYIRTTSNGGGANTYDLGITAGILPFEKIQAEIGIDYMEAGTNSDADKHPIYFNAKLGTPEDSIFMFSPALAVGIYNSGTKSGVTGQHIVYGLAARTLPIIGRISAGGFHGAENVLGSGKNNGLLLSWDRTMSEISDKLWLAVDYQSGNSAMGAFSFGVAWSFSKNVSVILGYDIYNNVTTGGKNTFTTQVDINFP